MALTKFLTNVNNISALSDRPNEIDGLTSAELKARFDKAGGDIKTYINEVLTEEVDEKLETIPDINNLVTNRDPRLTNSRQCNNSFDDWSIARSNLKIGYGTSLPSTADNGSIFFLYEE
jgi:hypothetical protein